MSTMALDVTHTDASAGGRGAPVYLGIWGMVLVESTVFGALISSYFYLQMMATNWPPAGTKVPELKLATINTVLLIVSAVLMHVGDKGIRKGSVALLKFGQLGALVLAFVFLGIKYVEYSDLEYRWDSHAYGSIVWTITGFHSAHVIAVVLKTLVMLVLTFKGFFSKENNLAVKVNGLYWDFVVVVWLPLYAVLYFAPRLLD